MSRDHHLVVMAKQPVLGQVKTRLAASIGEEQALAVYERLLAITRNAIVRWKGEAEIHVAGSPEPCEHFAIPRATWHAQVGEDLGARMSTAFQQAFERGAERVVLMGSDLPAVTSELIQEAFVALGSHDAVLGPANDGGYYLVGLKASHTGLFRNMAWSTDAVFRETVIRLEASGCSFHLLPTYADIDDKEQLFPAAWGDMLL